MKLRIKTLSNLPEGLEPSYATIGASGIDLFAAIDEPKTFQSGEYGLVPTGLSFDIPTGFEGQVRARSGLSSKFGFTVLNGPGTIDSDYRGEVQAIMINLGREPFELSPGMRFAQMVFVKVERAQIEFVLNLDETDRGAGGFGSTGL